MQIEHDEAADALYVRFADKPFHHTESLDGERHIDYAADGSVIGVEILYPSQGVLVDGLPERPAVERLLGEHRIQVLV